MMMSVMIKMMNVSRSVALLNHTSIGDDGNDDYDDPDEDDDDDYDDPDEDDDDDDYDNHNEDDDDDYDDPDEDDDDDDDDHDEDDDDDYDDPHNVGRCGTLLTDDPTWLETLASPTS